jgi:hypothetical protein
MSLALAHFAPHIVTMARAPVWASGGFQLGANAPLGCDFIGTSSLTPIPLFRPKRRLGLK